MAWAALLKADIVALGRSWVFRGWLIALALTTFFGLATALSAGRGGTIPASVLTTMHLTGFLVIWSMVIIVLSAGAVSLEAEMVSDGILSRACTRTQYILAKLVCRAGAVVLVFAITSSIAGYAAWRYAVADVTPATLASGILVVGLAMLMLVSLGVLFSVAFNNAIVAIIGMLLLWYVASPIMAFLGVEYLSPAALGRDLPALLRDRNAPQVVQAVATPSSVTVTFSKKLDARSAEAPGGITVEGSESGPATPETAVYDADRRSVLLGGLDLRPGETVTVTARGVTDPGGNPVSPAADSATATVPAQPGETPARRADATRAREEPSAEPVAGTPPAAARATPRKRPRTSSGDRQAPRVTQVTATASAVRVRFSEPLDRESAETVANYVVESPPGTTRTPRSATWEPATRTVTLAGLDLPQGETVQVTVKGVTDEAGNPIGRRGNSGRWVEVTTWKYVLGFLAPTLVFSALAVAWFSRRDL